MTPTAPLPRPFGYRFLSFMFCVVVAAALAPRLGLFLDMTPSLPLAALILLAPFAGILELTVLAGVGAFLFVPPQLAIHLFSFSLLLPFLVRVLQRHVPALEGFLGTGIFICSALVIYYVLIYPGILTQAPLLVLEDIFLSLFFSVIMAWVLRIGYDDFVI